MLKSIIDLLKNVSPRVLEFISVTIVVFAVSVGSMIFVSVRGGWKLMLAGYEFSGTAPERDAATLNCKSIASAIRQFTGDLNLVKSTEMSKIQALRDERKAEKASQEGNRSMHPDRSEAARLRGEYLDGEIRRLETEFLKPIDDARTAADNFSEKCALIGI